MSMHKFKQEIRTPKIGKIRLGIRKETDKGTEYPESVNHFVLHDAPEVAKAYGDKPTEIDAFFLTDDIDEAIPNWFKWYSGGKRDKAGNIVGGDLQCYGSGIAGKNDDGSIIPGQAHHMAKRDPITREIPTRPCLEEKCPDFFGSNGRPQCGPTMTVNIFVPLACLDGIFTIDTKSVTSISRFISQLTFIKDQFGKLKGIPFKIYREPVSLQVPNKPGQKKTHYILSIKPNQEFIATKGHLITGRYSDIINSNILLPNAQEMISAPMEDHYDVVEDEYVSTESKVASAAEIAESPEVAPLFEKLCSLTGKNNTTLTRLLTARKFEKEADPKVALVSYLTLLISGFKPAQSHVAEAEVAVPDANGLI